MASIRVVDEIPGWSMKQWLWNYILLKEHKVYDGARMSVKDVQDIEINYR